MPRQSYWSEKRPPPSRQQLTKLFDSLIDTYVAPNVPKENIDNLAITPDVLVLIPSITWDYKIKGARVQVVYRFDAPRSIEVIVLCANSFRIENATYTPLVSILHTTDTEYNTSLKDLCSLAIANAYKDELSTLSNKIPETLLSHVQRCAEDKQDFSSELKEKVSYRGPTPDHFSVLYRHSDPNERDYVCVGSELSFTSTSDFVLSPNADYLSPPYLTRHLCLLDGKNAVDSPIFNGERAPPSVMNEAKYSSPKVLSSFLNSPEEFLQSTNEHMRHLSKFVSDAVDQMRYVYEMDLAYAGGGLSGVTCEIKGATDQQRQEFLGLVEKNEKNTSKFLTSTLHELVTTVKDALSAIYSIKLLVKDVNEKLLIFDRGFNWDEYLEKD